MFSLLRIDFDFKKGFLILREGVWKWNDKKSDAMISKQ